MGLTITEKILRDHCQNKNATAGDFVIVDIDKCLANDITAPIAIKVFEEVISGTDKDIFDSKKVILVPDHFTPNKDIASAIQSKILRDFAAKRNINNYFEVGRGGIEHCLIPEKCLFSPGDVFIGSDSRTCTYGALGAFATGVGSTDLGVAMATGKCWLKITE
jgi:3-isopropylmalate/(R)-2-methylmalate dehydratase large subunit